MKVMYVRAANTRGTATTEEAAILSPGMMPAMFMASTPRKRVPSRGAKRRPFLLPRSMRATLLRTKSAMSSSTAWPRPGTVLSRLAATPTVRHKATL